MEISTEYKSYNRDKSVEELKYDSNNWKKKLEFLKVELAFLKQLLDSNIYEPKTINLFESLQLFKQNIDNVNKELLHLADKTTFYIDHLDENLKCKYGDCNRFYIEIHEKMAYDLDVLFEDSNILKLEIFQYIQSAIKK